MVGDYVGNCLRRYAFLNHLCLNGLKEIMEKNWNIVAEIRSPDRNQEWHNGTWCRVWGLLMITVWDVRRDWNATHATFSCWDSATSVEKHVTLTETLNSRRSVNLTVLQWAVGPSEEYPCWLCNPTLLAPRVTENSNTTRGDALR